MNSSFRDNERDGLHVQSIEQTHNPADRSANAYTSQPPLIPWKQPNDTQKEFSPKTPHGSYYGNPPTYATTKQRRNPCGLGPLMFAAVVALITAVVVGGAVGGGLSSAISARKNCSVSPNNSSAATGDAARASSIITVTTTVGGSSPTSTGSVRNYSPLPAAQVETLANKCPDLDGLSLQSAQGSFFKVTCDQHILGSQGASGVTIGQSLAYTLQDCVNSCSLMNFWKGSNVCVGITWETFMAASAAAHGGGNCWLFSDTSNVGELVDAVSARLQK